MRVEKACCFYSLVHTTYLAFMCSVKPHSHLQTARMTLPPPVYQQNPEIPGDCSAQDSAKVTLPATTQVSCSTNQGHFHSPADFGICWKSSHERRNVIRVMLGKCEHAGLTMIFLKAQPLCVFVMAFIGSRAWKMSVDPLN